MRRFSLWKLSAAEPTADGLPFQSKWLLIALCEWPDLNNVTTCSYRSKRRLPPQLR